MNELAALVRQRANGRCEYCLLPSRAMLPPFHIEHVVARQHGGETCLENLAFACGRCNRKKGPNLAGIDPNEGTLTPLFNPRAHLWSTHFEVDPRPSGIEIRGKTAIGRTTVLVLGLNDEMRIWVRTKLWQERIWPR